MKKIAIVGNAGGGKSTLAKALSEKTGLPLYSIDKLKFKPGGQEIAQEDYLQVHQDILTQEEWILDGFGCVPSTWARMEAADTVIFLDLPLWQHAFRVTKRLFKGFFVLPEGWPERSPILKSSWNSYRVLWLCHQKLTPRYRQFVAGGKSDKSVFHLRTTAELKRFIETELA